MPAYLIVRADISNMQQYLEYTKLTPAILARFGGRFLARGGQTVTLEGPEASSRIVLIEFPSIDQAVACYNSPEYQEAKQVRAGAAEAQFVVVEGAQV